MAAAIELRNDFSGDDVRDVRRLARASGDAKQVRRLLAVAVILDGGTRTEAARLGGVGLQIVRDWVLRFNAEGPEGLVDREAPGKAPTLTAEQRAALARVVEAGPEPWRDGVVRWRRIDLVQWLWEEFEVSVSEETVGRELRALGFRKLSARPRHYAQDPEAAEAFKNVWPAPSASRFLRCCRRSRRQRIRHRSSCSPPRWSFARPGPHKARGVEAPNFEPGFRNAVRLSGHLRPHLQIFGPCALAPAAYRVQAAASRRP